LAQAADLKVPTAVEQPDWLSRRRRTWYQVGRLAVLGTLSISGAFFLEQKGAGTEYVTAGLLAVLTTIFSLAFIHRRPGSRFPYWFLAISDGFILGLMVHYGGGINGPFVIVFYFHVLAAGLLLGTRAGVIAAGLDIFILLASGLLVTSGHLIPSGSALLNVLIVSGQKTLTFEFILLRVCIEAALLLTIGLVSGYLSESLSKETGKLKMVLQNLADARARSRWIIESLSDGVVVVDNDGRPISINSAALSLLGISENWETGLAETRIASCLSSYLQDEQFPQTIEIVLGERVVECRLGRFMDGSGVPSGALAVLTDVTEARNLRGALEERDRLSFIGRLSATMAHEIRNPLASVSGAAQMLSRGGLDVTKTERMTSLIVRQSRRISELIEGYLELSRESRDYEMGAVHLADVLEDVIENIVHGIGREVDIEFEADDPCAVNGNAGRLNQLATNLIRNAIEAVSGREDGSVNVTVSRSEDGVSAELVVTDNGPGIPIELADRIWSPFFTTRQEGTGLGLYVSRKIAEDHRGSIGIERPADGGTRMVFTLPLVPPEPKQEPERDRNG
jgi:two-component system sensor histidine kinase PilS (NtrC family)